MIKKLRKNSLALTLIVLIGIAEMICILLCSKIIPDFKNTVFVEDKQNITQLMLVESEDNSRFYPWLSYNEDKCISLADYIKSSYESISSEEVIDFKDTETFLNEEVHFILHMFDGEDKIKQDLNFASKITVDTNSGMAYLKDFECQTENNRKKFLDLAVNIETGMVYYYRLHSKEDFELSSSYINSQSKQLINDFDYILDNFQENFFRVDFYDDDGNLEEYQSYNAMQKNDYTVSETKMDFSEYDTQEYNINNNAVIRLLDRIDKNVSVFSADFDCEIPDLNIFYYFYENNSHCHFIVSIPSYIPNLQYNVFSYENELMTVFSGNRNQNNEKIIIYYSLIESKITGFSIGKF